MNSDWQDKTSNLLKRCEIAKSYNETICVWPDAIIELINKATAEKARADQIKEFWEEVAAEQAQSYLDSFAREEKLKEVMEWAIEQSKWGDPENALDKIVSKLQNTLSTLYPKEETE